MRLPSLIVKLLVPALFFVACGAEVIDEEGDPPTDQTKEPPPDAPIDETREEPATYPLEGTACDTFCGGPACNYRCEGDVLYHCGGDSVYRVVEDCGADGRSCEFVEAEDFLDSEKICV